MSVSRLHPSFTFTEDRLSALRTVVPEAFADGRINWTTLREALGDWLEDDAPEAEHFGLTWPGKRDARRLAAMPARGALVPATGEGVNEESTRNVFIEGDNLEVLKLLQKSYAGRVKMIYIDPPYNTGNDFVYRDDFSDPIGNYLRLTGQVSQEGLVLTTNRAADGRFHSKWLSMMYSRLLIARSLLRDDGVLFASIDDNEVHNLRYVLNEVMGEENFLASFIWHRRQIPDSRNESKVSTDHEYVLAFRRSPVSLRGNTRDPAQYSNPDNDPRGPWTSTDLTGLATKEQRPNLHYVVINPEDGKRYPPSPTRGWSIAREKFEQYIADHRILWPSRPSGRPRLKRFLADARSETTALSTMLKVGFTQEGTKTIQDLFGEKAIQFPKPVSLLTHLVTQATSDDDLVVDFFSGSSTTAHAVLECNRSDGGNRRFLCIQLPEETSNSTLPTIAELGKERIRRVLTRLQRDERRGENLGFRVYKLGQSNFRAWRDYDGTDLAELDSLFTDAETPLVNGWTAVRLLPEVMLLEGFPLDSSVVEKRPDRKRVFVVEHPEIGHRLLACFEEKVDPSIVNGFELRDEDVFVCLDSALTDRAKMQLEDRCALRTI